MRELGVAKAAFRVMNKPFNRIVVIGNSRVVEFQWFVVIHVKSDFVMSW